MNGKHAYMIMAHNDFPILIEILKELDHERNEIFLHIDKKTTDYPKKQIFDSVKRGKLYLFQNISVSWGGYSQIDCELLLMRKAVEAGRHDYYHLSTGATFPLKTVQEILDFFDQHKGFQFIGYDNSKDYSGRVKRYNVFNEIGKASTKSDQRKAFIRNKFRGLQQRIGYVYGPAQNIEFKKGFVYWSLTEDAVKFILGKSAEIEKVFKHSFCGDELFVQTFIYHSSFKEKIYNYEDEYKSCLRYVKPVQSWEKNFSGSSVTQSNIAENGITYEDIDVCKKSDMLFGLKFVGKAGLEAIDYLRKSRR